MEDTVWRHRSVMAESAVTGSSSLDSWRTQWQETNRVFYQALNKVRIQQGVPPINHPSLQIENQENDRSVFVKIHDEKYTISEDVLEQLFSEFGVLESIEKFGPSKGFHSLVRVQNKKSAIKAFNSLNGRDVYDNCCQLELSLVASAVSSSSNQEREILAEVEVENQMSEIKGAPIEYDGDCQEEVEAPDANANQFEAPFANGIQSEALVIVKNPMEVPIANQEQEITGSSHEIVDRKNKSGLHSTSSRDSADQTQEVSKKPLSESSKVSSESILLVWDDVERDRNFVLEFEETRVTVVKVVN